MNKDIERFKELLLKDPEFQEKLRTAAENYTGDKTEEAVFDHVLVPVASEYGITATFSEYQEYIAGLSDSTEPMSSEELQQVAGGEGKGAGATACYAGLGVGFGGGEDTYEDDPNHNMYGGCFVVGAGQGVSACWGKGYWNE